MKHSGTIAALQSSLRAATAVAIAVTLARLIVPELISLEPKHGTLENARSLFS